MPDTRLPNTIRWRDFSAGNMQKVSPDIVAQSAVPFSMNLLFEEYLGEVISRLGTNIIGAQLSAGNLCRGLFQHIESTFANSKLLAAFNGSIYNVTAGSSLISGLTATAESRFLTYLNNTLILNGVTADARSYSLAAGVLSTGGVFDLANLPALAQFPTEFKDRAYVAVTDKIYYTATPSAGVLSWTASGSGNLLISQEDGGGVIQGLNKVPGYLMIYKQRSLKRWDFTTTFPDDLVNIGTQSNESIVQARGMNFFFYGPNGFYQTNGGYPKRISRPIQRFVDGIASSFYSHINGWSDNIHVYWAVGDVTVDFGRGYQETYTNVVLRYTIDTEQWAPMRYAHAFRRLAQYISGTDVLIAGGDSNGQILQLNTGKTDYPSTPLTYILQSPEFEFGRRETNKTITEKIIVHSDNTVGAELQARLNYGEWKTIGKINDIVSQVDIKSLRANIFEFRIVDSISGQQCRLRGLDFPNVIIHEDTKV